MRRVLFSLVACSLTLSALAGSNAERKRELAELRKELRHVDLLAREDLVAMGPASAAGAVTELWDGSVYVQADPAIVFEKLGALRVNKLVLRGGQRLIVRLVPPSDLRPRIVPVQGERPIWDRTMETGPDRGRALSVSVDLDDHASLREALSTLVFLPGQAPSKEEVAACLARYPDHEERTSRLRCGASE